MKARSLLSQSPGGIYFYRHKIALGPIARLLSSSSAGSRAEANIESLRANRAIETILESGPKLNPARRDSEDPLLGARLGPVEVRERLGAGGMGAVYRARHVMLDKEVAVKVMLADAGLDPDAIQRFQREAQLAARLEHPNIVATTDFGAEGARLYIVMRLVRGEGLDRRIRREGRLALGEALRIARGVASGLSYAHSQGLVHRDIKPANILLSETGEVLISDFGLARGNREGEAGLTVSGAIMGTPAYMAPEQCEGRSDVDGRADFFALGLILYQMLSGGTSG
jgi:serine/threonine protein kinase